MTRPVAHERPHTERVRWLVGFLGRGVLLLLALSVALGGLLFGAELALAIGLQDFAGAVGLAQPPTRGLLDPAHPVLGALLLTALAAVRGALSGAGAFAQGAATERFKHAHRTKLVRWVFASSEASSTRVDVLFNEQVNQAGRAIAHLQAALLDATVVVGLAVGLFALAPTLTAAVLPLLAIPLIPLRLLRRRLAAVSESLISDWTRATRRLTAGIKNLLLLRIHGTAAQEGDLAEESLARCLDHTLAYHRLASAETAYTQTLSVAIVCVVVLAVERASGLSPRELLAYFYLLYRFLQQLARLGYALSSLAFETPHLRGLAAWWEEASHAREAERPAEDTPPLEGPLGFRLDRVELAYPGAHAPLVRALSVDVAPGSALVITGPSGSGKTTLLALFAGQIAPTSGSVEVRDARRVLPMDEARGVLPSCLGYVGSDSFVVEGTIRDNLLYGLGREPMADAIDAALAAAGCGFTRALKDGIEHRLSDQGEGISAGQKQRLGLARALLRNPRALLLDEVTGHLDAAAEEELIASLRDLKGRVTLIAATHRAALLDIADQRIDLGELAAGGATGERFETARGVTGGGL